MERSGLDVICIEKGDLRESAFVRVGGTTKDGYGRVNNAHSITLVLSSFI